MNGSRRHFRIGGLAVSLTSAALVASLLPTGLVSTVLGDTSVTQAATNTAIPADTTGTTTYAALPDLKLQEALAGDIKPGTLILTAPAGFAWKSSGASAATSSCTGLSASVTAQSTIAITVTFIGTSSAPCLVTVSTIQIIPTQGTPLISPVAIGKSGTAGGLPSSGYGLVGTVAGTPTKLGFTSQPSTAPSGVTMLTQPAVAIQDSFGNTVTSPSAAASILLSLTAPTTGGPGTLGTCTSAVTTSAGVATFAGCKITGTNATGTGYRLTAADTTVGSGHPYTPGTSSAFDVPDNLTFEIQPGGGAGSGNRAQGGIAFSSQPKVTVRAVSTKAANDNTTMVTLSILAGTGTAGAVLTCDQAGNILKVTSGSAQFTGCKIDKAGTGYKLVATSSPTYGTSVWSSNAFDVVAGLASKLTFVQQPAGAVANTAFTTQPIVAITDAGGNVITSGVSAVVTLSIGTNPGVPAGVLSCVPGLSVATTTSGTNAGKAAFSGCKISNAGVGYTLVATASSVVCSAGACATSGVLASGTSTSFTVTPAQAQITVTPSANVITWGSGVTLTTRFDINGAGKSFQLLAARDGVNFSVIASLVTNSSGVATFAYRPATNLFYKAVFAGTSDLVAGTSNTTRVVVRQIALLRPTSLGKITSVSRGTTVTFTTTVRPSRPELAPAKVTFWIYRRVGTSWVFFTKRDYFINSIGIAKLTWKFSTSGTWFVRSAANPTPYNANSVVTRMEIYRVS
jgi:hypothetical protein